MLISSQKFYSTLLIPNNKESFFFILEKDKKITRKIDEGSSTSLKGEKLWSEVISLESKQ